VPSRIHSINPRIVWDTEAKPGTVVDGEPAAEP
jgi:hypothetical protein